PPLTLPCLPYTTLFRSGPPPAHPPAKTPRHARPRSCARRPCRRRLRGPRGRWSPCPPAVMSPAASVGSGVVRAVASAATAVTMRSEEHTSELQSRENLV